MISSNRRYDIDWLRVIAIGLLLLYHTAIGFQPWGIMIGFITSETSWQNLWLPMTMLNVWRIPLLFFVSGMGVYFSIQHRNWKQLLRERLSRILLPLLFGIFFIVPISAFIWQYYYHWSPDYQPGLAHLWFLGNICIYVLLLCPVFFYFKRNETGKPGMLLKKLLSNPLGLLPFIAAFVVEALLVDPGTYEMYAMTWHGFFLGLLAFLSGFCFVLSGDAFWKMIKKWRYFFLCVAATLYIYRLFQFQLHTPGYQLAIESNFWIISIFAFAYRHLNRPGKVLSYLSQAIYPVYILHMVFLFLGSVLIFPLAIDIRLKFIFLLLFTGIGCFLKYEFIIRRVNRIRPLFGLKMKQQSGRGFS